jgi:hypothetical protein
MTAKLSTALMTFVDKEAVEFVINKKLPILRYNFKGLDWKNEEFEYTGFFAPAQLRAITAVGWPECATVENCTKLLGIWNKSNTRGKYTLLDAEVME